MEYNLSKTNCDCEMCRNNAKASSIFHRSAMERVRKLFNHKVQETKNDLFIESAEDILSQLKFQYDYREGGIIDLTFDELLTEIAQKKVLGIDCVDGRVTDEHIKEWI